MSTIKHIWNISKSVYLKELTQTGGARELERLHDVNINSAKIGITVYGKLIQGLEFKRALNSDHMEYYLNQFFVEGGSKALLKPLRALSQHIQYYEAKNKVNCRSLRKLENRFNEKLYSSTLLSEIELEFQAAVDNSRQITTKERERILKSTTKTPEIRTATVQVYIRNPHVVASVLLRADRTCEKCHSNAPFIRKKDGSPYLEVHHKTQLANGGDDSVENAIALCPNCHRELHFGR